MSKTLNQQWMHQPHLKKIIKTLGKDKVRFIGGCVRDALLGREIHDVDMATTITPDRVIQQLESAKIKAVPTGLAHGTITAVCDGIPVEITTLRSDTSCDGRHADVRFTTSWKEDASRRDFTINALSCGSDGIVHDYCNGLDDITRRDLRFIGDARQRCQEDYLRILRYFRFFATLEINEIDAQALSACKGEKDGIKTLSGERIQHEMLRLLACKAPLKALKMMERTAILSELLLSDVKCDALASLKSIETTLSLTPSAFIRLATLCRANQMDSDKVEAITARWKLSNKDKTLLNALCFPAKKFAIENNTQQLQRLIRLYGTMLFQSHLIIEWALGDTTEKAAQFLELFYYASNWDIPIFPLEGKDLVAHHIKPGKQLGELLKAAEQHWEAKHYQPSRRELLDFCLKMAQ